MWVLCAQHFSNSKYLPHFFKCVFVSFSLNKKKIREKKRNLESSHAYILLFNRGFSSSLFFFFLGLIIEVKIPLSHGQLSAIHDQLPNSFHYWDNDSFSFPNTTRDAIILAQIWILCLCLFFKKNIISAPELFPFANLATFVRSIDLRGNETWNCRDQTVIIHGYNILIKIK